MNANNSTVSDLDSLLTETQLAQKLGVTVACLQRWRWQGRGPAYFKLGRLVRYDLATVIAFLRERGAEIRSNDCWGTREVRR